MSKDNEELGELTPEELQELHPLDRIQAFHEHFFRVLSVNHPELSEEQVDDIVALIAPEAAHFAREVFVMDFIQRVEESVESFSPQKFSREALEEVKADPLEAVHQTVIAVSGSLISNACELLDESEDSFVIGNQRIGNA